MKTRPRSLLALAALAALLLGATPAPGGASLAKLTQKKLAQAEHKLGKLETRQAKQQAKLDVLDAAHAAAETALNDAADTLADALLALQAAETALDDALALPQETPEQAAARADAVKLANAQLAAAAKDHKQAQKALNKRTKKLAKLGGKLAKRAAKLAAVASKIADLEADLEQLGADFGWESTHSVAFAGVLRDDEGAPLAGAQLSVLDTLVAPKPKQQIEADLSPAVYWQGVTQADGSFAAELALPHSREQVDVVVVLAGYEGDYTHAALRELWGPFAPAARVAQDVDALDDLELVLAEVAP